MEKNKIKVVFVLLFVLLVITQVNSQNTSLQPIPVVEHISNSSVQETLSVEENKTNQTIITLPMTTYNSTNTTILEEKEKTPLTGFAVVENTETSEEMIILPMTTHNSTNSSAQKENKTTTITGLSVIEETLALEPLLPPPHPGSRSQFQTLSQGTQEFGENWKTICNSGTCLHTLYPYQKYYQKQGIWTQINENFYSTNCQNGYNYCVNDNLYQVHMKTYPNTDNPILFSLNGATMSFTPKNIQYKHKTSSQKQAISSIQQSPSQVTQNKAIYPSAFQNNIDIQFKYLPRMFKEEIIIPTKNTLPTTNLSQTKEEITFDIEFSFEINQNTQILLNNKVWNKQSTETTQGTIEISDGTNTFYILPPIAYDARLQATTPTYILENKNNEFYLTLEMPYEWLTETTRTYPIIVDPTITLDDSSINWDGNVNYDGGTEEYWRLSNEIDLLLGNSPNVGEGFIYYRSDIDWDIGSVPDNAQITDISLDLYVNLLGYANDNIKFYHMLGGSENYTNNNNGNKLFYNDIGNGTQYLSQALVNASTNTFNLTKSSQLSTDFETLLSSGIDEWNIGFRSDETGDPDAAPNYIRASEAELQANRPALQIIYAPYASESEGDAAINQGIINALGSGVSIHNETQMYTRNESNAQQLGLFDKLTTDGSKRWVINYVTSGESFTNMYNISNTVFILEMQNLYEAEITKQVQDFISGTV